MKATIAAETVTYYYTDPLGSPLVTTNAGGQVITSLDYAPYGRQVLGAAQQGPGYTNHVNDVESGLIYMNARYFDATAGRFLSVDPVAPSSGNTMNFNDYAYADNNPIRNFDPLGMYTCTGPNCDQIDRDMRRIRDAERHLPPGKKRDAVKSVLAAYGEKGKKGTNGADVAFVTGATLDPGTYADTKATGNNSFTILIGDANQDHDFASVAGRYDLSDEKASSVLHEGQHVLDAVLGMAQSNGWDDTLLRELNAFRTEAYFHEGINRDGYFHLFNPNLNEPERMRVSHASIYQAAYNDALNTCMTRACPGKP